GRKWSSAVARHSRRYLFGEIAIRFDKYVLFYDAFVFFKRTFNPVPCDRRLDRASRLRSCNRHESPSQEANPESRSLFTNAESAHRCLPPVTMCGSLNVN